MTSTERIAVEALLDASMRVLFARTREHQQVRRELLVATLRLIELIFDGTEARGSDAQSK